MTTPAIRSCTRPVDPALGKLLQELQPGQQIRVTQTVRVGQKEWTTTVNGAFRNVQYLATGLATHRPAEEEIIVATVHFTKENGEHSSVALDENSKIEKV